MMRRRVGFLALTAAAWLACASAAHAAPFTFMLLPASGEIAGPPGSTIGWGYTIENDTADWLELTGVSPDPVTDATTDTSLFDFPILAPHATRTLPYDGALFQGLFQITWDALAPAGFSNTGIVVVSANFWDGDPFAGGNLLAAADDQSAQFTARVAAPVVAAEPAMLLLVATGAAALARKGDRTRSARA